MDLGLIFRAAAISTSSIPEIRIAIICMAAARTLESGGR
jgi:hypothetical protein